MLALARAEVEFETRQPCAVRGFTRDALERLRSHSWPGNERELREPGSRGGAALRAASDHQ